MRKQSKISLDAPPALGPLELRSFVTTPTQQVVGGGHEPGSEDRWESGNGGEDMNEN